jgi:hypothetical protein
VADSEYAAFFEMIRFYSALDPRMHPAWMRRRSFVMTILFASLAIVTACREWTSKDDVRVREWGFWTVPAAESESGLREWRYKVVPQKWDPVVELRFQVPEDTKPLKATNRGSVMYVMMDPSEKIYRFSSSELFARAAEYKKTQYHRLEDFEVSSMPEGSLTEAE